MGVRASGIVFLGSVLFMGCIGAGEDLADEFPRTTMHEAVETGIQYDFTYRAGDELPAPGREGMWVSKMNYYPNLPEGAVIAGAENHTMAINEGDTWDLGELAGNVVFDVQLRTIDGFDPMDRVAYTAVVLSDTMGVLGTGDTNDLLQEAVRDADGKVTLVKRWGVQVSEDEAAPTLPGWQGGSLTTLELCPEAERIAQGDAVQGWCAFACELVTLDAAHQLGEYELCAP